MIALKGYDTRFQYMPCAGNAGVIHKEHYPLTGVLCHPHLLSLHQQDIPAQEYLSVNYRFIVMFTATAG
jgi:hypothetical protein